MMKNLNNFNRFLAGMAIILAGIFVFKIFSYQSWKRYNYVSNVSVPEEFPVNIIGIWFYMQDGDIVSDFYKDQDVTNSFHSNWGFGEYLSSDETAFLPKSLFVEYVDFRTKNYYMDTIQLPQEKMVEVFNEAKVSGHLANLHYMERKMGLEFHVGIANDGHLIFWLIGDNFEREFYRIQIKPKSFPDKLASYAEPKIIQNKEVFIQNLFGEIPDSVKLKILSEDVSNVQYKDSIPRHFRNFKK